MAAAASTSAPASAPRDSLDETDKKGAFVRTEMQFRHQIPSAEYPAEKGRYHLYVSYACPWASRCLAVRALKGLEDAIGVTVCHPVWEDTNPGGDKHRGWMFKSDPDMPGAEEDPLYGCKSVRDLYYKLAGKHVVKFTVPMLVDTKTDTVVNNESSEIIRMLNHGMDEFSANRELGLYPEALRAEIDAMNAKVYEPINNGVYKCGFAKTQEAYEEAFAGLSAGLDMVEEHLSKNRYLVGGRLTEADLRLVVTLWRHDPVYSVHFKCNMPLIRERPALLAYCRDMYQLPGVASTVNMQHIKHHYYGSHPTINTYGVVPVGTDEGFDKPHGRDSVGEEDASIKAFAAGGGGSS